MTKFRKVVRNGPKAFDSPMWRGLGLVFWWRNWAAAGVLTAALAIGVTNPLDVAPWPILCIGVGLVLARVVLEDD